MSIMSLFTGEPRPVRSIERPTATIVNVSEVSESYLETAKRAGVQSGAVVQAALTKWFAENGIRTYDLDKVELYLTSKLGVGKREFEKSTWVWYPLRKCDVDVLRRGFRDDFNGGFFHRQYQRPVPEPVLHTVANMLDGLATYRDVLHFYVADKYIESEFKDPFMGVTSSGMDMQVFECWDEPGFQR